MSVIRQSSSVPSATLSQELLGGGVYGVNQASGGEYNRSTAVDGVLRTIVQKTIRDSFDVPVKSFTNSLVTGAIYGVDQTDSSGRYLNTEIDVWGNMSLQVTQVATEVLLNDNPQRTAQITQSIVEILVNLAPPPEMSVKGVFNTPIVMI
jgi:hypothetical protein